MHKECWTRAGFCVSASPRAQKQSSALPRVQASTSWVNLKREQEVKSNSMLGGRGGSQGEDGGHHRLGGGAGFYFTMF